jgi:hypothetical protein
MSGQGRARIYPEVGSAVNKMRLAVHRIAVA